jgi:hypothetical protein
MRARFVLGLCVAAGVVSSAPAKKSEPVITLNSAQLRCLLEGYPLLKGSLAVDQKYRAHISTSPVCEVELAPEREGKGGGVSVRFLPDAGYEVLRTK